MAARHPSNGMGLRPGVETLFKSIQHPVEKGGYHRNAAIFVL